MHHLLYEGITPSHFHRMDSRTRRPLHVVTKVDSEWNGDRLPDVEMNIDERLLNVRAAFAVDHDQSMMCGGEVASAPSHIGGDMLAGGAGGLALPLGLMPGERMTWNDFTSVFDQGDIASAETASAASSTVNQNLPKETNAANVL